MKVSGTRPLVTLVALALAASLAPHAAWANRQDLQLWRLGNPSLDSAANDRFRMLMVDLGMAMTPTPMHPAETLGRDGGSYDLGARYAQVHSGATVPAGSGGCPTGNSGCKVWVNQGTEPGASTIKQPDSALLMPVIQLRRGLPFSFEFDTKIQYVAYSEMFAATAGFRWTLNEGFDFLPDVSIGGQGTRMLGNRDFGLTTAALDVMIGKNFGLAGMFVLAPYAGWQRVWVSGVSQVIDFKPGTEDPANPTVDDSIFKEVLMGANAYDRFFIGLRFNTYLLQLSAEATYEPGYLGLGGQFVFAGKIGVAF